MKPAYKICLYVFLVVFIYNYELSLVSSDLLFNKNKAPEHCNELSENTSKHEKFQCKFSENEISNSLQMNEFIIEIESIPIDTLKINDDKYGKQNPTEFMENTKELNIVHINMLDAEKDWNKCVMLNDELFFAFYEKNQIVSINIKTTDCRIINTNGKIMDVIEDATTSSLFVSYSKDDKIYITQYDLQTNKFVLTKEIENGNSKSCDLIVTNANLLLARPQNELIYGFKKDVLKLRGKMEFERGRKIDKIFGLGNNFVIIIDEIIRVYDIESGNTKDEYFLFDTILDVFVSQNKKFAYFIREDIRTKTKYISDFNADTHDVSKKILFSEKLYNSELIAIHNNNFYVID